MPENESGNILENAEKVKPVSYEGVAAGLPKGGTVDVEARLEAGVVTSDTGVFTSFLEAYADRTEFTPAELDALYEASISHGIVDHHSIDMFLAARGIRSEKCATRMAADYAPAILRLIKEKGIKSVETHFDSDLDAVSSAYLIKSLIENGRLPALADALATITNETDYGRLSERGERFENPELFVKTLPGIFGSLKAEFSRLASERIRAEGFSPAILAQSEAARNTAFFEVLNAIEKHGLDATGDLSVLDGLLPVSVKERLDSGRQVVKEDYEQFLTEFEQAERKRMKIRSQDGREIEANLVIAESRDPLGFTNLTYMRTSPDTVVAVFAGPDRRAGDHYDIGIQPDQAKVLDLRGLTIALNKAEMRKRQAILSKPETEQTEEEQKLAAAWTTGADREAFVGLKGMIAQGELSAEEVPLKDPTVLVAGGSLIAASRSAQLDSDEFRKVFEEFIAK